MIKPIIILDQDEVLTDFRGAACRVHAVCPDAVARAAEPGEWDIVPAIRKVLGLPDSWGHDEFWSAIDEVGAGFWEHLEPTSYMQGIIALAEEYGREWYVATSPSEAPECYLGKALWLKRHFGRKFNRFFPAPYKHLLAAPDRILIGDRDKTINRFVEAGGQAIVFPHRGNSKWHHAGDPLTYVRNRLSSFSSLH